jgi:hypothetical protein
VAALFSADGSALAQAARRFNDDWGPIDYLSEPMAFDQTDYYRPEMGGPLIKRFFASERLVDPPDLVAVKEWAWGVERELALEDGRRVVNIDPGLVSRERLILATGKNAGHRVYLGRGVWADVTLLFRSGGFEPLPWTYPDYATPEVRAVIGDVRKKYLDQLRRIRREAS